MSSKARAGNARAGVTLMELLVYLGMATVVVLVMTNFLVGFTRQLLVTRDQERVQQNARVVLEKLTHAGRNATSLTVNGSCVTLQAAGTAPTRVFSYDGATISYGEALPCGDPGLRPLIETGVAVSAVTFEPVLADGAPVALAVAATFRKGSREAAFRSTITLRQ